MDLTGSIADATAPLSSEIVGSVGVDGLSGSSFIDTMALVAFLLPRFVLQTVADIGADLGSTTGGFTFA